MKRAGVTIKSIDKKYIINSVNTLLSGGGIASEPYMIEEQLSSEELLDKIKIALEASKDGVERTDNGSQKDFLKKNGFKSMKDLHDGTIYLSILLRDNVLTFMPRKNAGPKEGFVDFKVGEDISIPFDSSESTLISALEKALNQCH